MQSSKEGKPTDFKVGELGELSKEAREQLSSGAADSVVIANMPKKGEEVEIRGIKFTVQQLTKSGNIILEPQGRK